MQKNWDHFMFRNLFIWVAIFLITTVQIHSEMCQHCQGPVHESINEVCLQCNRRLKDCTFFHTITPPLTPEEIVSTSEPNLLMDILFKLKDKYKALTGRNLPSHEIFKKGNEIFAEYGIVLPKVGFKKMKDAVKKRENNELYLSRCLAVMPKSFEKSEEFQQMLLLAKTTVTDDSDEVPYPLKLKCGVFLTWCGCAMTILSDGVLAPAGYWVTSTGAVMSADGMIEYKERLNEHARQRVEQARIRAEKEARDAEKQARKDAEKAEKRRLKEIEKQKEERRRLKKKQDKNLSAIIGVIVGARSDILTLN